MVFVDDLVFELFVLGFSGLLFVYLMSVLYLDYRRKAQKVLERLDSVSVVLLIIGVYIFAMSFISQLTWFLPGAYNILFYDPLMALGIIIVAFSLSVRYKVKLQYAGFLSLLFGFMTIWYGISGYNLNLTAEPLALLGLFGFFGLAGIFSYPVTIFLDRLPGYKRIWRGWNAFLILFWVFLVAASILALYMGAAAIPAHLTTPP